MGKRTRYTVRTKTGVHEIDADGYIGHSPFGGLPPDFLQFFTRLDDGATETVALIRADIIEAIFVNLPVVQIFPSAQVWKPA
jgi:hypothetical protein